MDRPLNTALGWRIPPKLLTIGPVAVIVLEGLLAIHFHKDGTDAISQLGLGIALALSAAALLVRHRFPLLTLSVVLGVTLGLNYGPIAMLPLLLAMFTVAEYTERPKTVLAAAGVGAILVLTPFIHGVEQSFPAVLSRLVAVGLALALGLYLRTRADYIVGLRERAERLEREQELLAEQAVASEQVRIARELHDVVAHNVSLMVVQAQALAATGDETPERVQSLHRVADLGREAMSEMHRMLGVLRPTGGDALELSPQPGVRDLESVIARTREAGIEASLTVLGEPHELPAGVDLSAYRIAQEALTNVIRHASANRVDVTLRFGHTALELNVVDDGVGPTSNGNGSTPGGGHGLVGMRERVALFGGSLTTGPAPGGRGYLVHAVLPLS
jgi:signal transduction histidine kinase